MFKYFVFKVAQWLANFLPENFVYWIAVILSDLQYYFSFKDRRAVSNNLKNILTDTDDLSRTTREVFRNFGRYLVEFFRMQRFVDKAYIDKRIRIDHLQRVDDVLARGKGGIILTAHIGNWELGAVMLSLLGYPLMAIALPHKERSVNRMFNDQREAKGLRVVPTKSAIRQCREWLKENKLVALVGDRTFGSKGEALDLFGRQALIPRGAAVFSLQTGAPIIPCFLIREKGNHFRVSIGEPIFPPDNVVSEREAMVDMMTRYTNILQNEIRQFPGQWLMFREYWIK